MKNLLILFFLTLSLYADMNLVEISNIANEYCGSIEKQKYNSSIKIKTSPENEEKLIKYFEKRNFQEIEINGKIIKKSENKSPKTIRECKLNIVKELLKKE